MQRAGEHSHNDIYLSHIYGQRSNADIYKHIMNAMNGGRDKTRANEELQPFYLLSTQSLNSSLLDGQGATTFIQRKTPGKERAELDPWAFNIRGAVETARAPRGRAGYLPPSW